MEPIFPANPIDRVGWYGGRIADGLWGEPLNLASDICFVIFIVLFYLKLRKEGFSDTPVLILVILGGLVGLGSTIFHSHPNRVTLKIDLIPITIFGVAYLLFSMRRYFNHNYKISLLVTFAFMVCNILFEMAAKHFKIIGMNHLPAILGLIIMGTFLLKNGLHARAGKAFMIASGLYIIALFFRYLDLFIFRSFPLGTHFLWHLFTASVVGLLLYTAATGQNNTEES